MKVQGPKRDRITPVKPQAKSANCANSQPKRESKKPKMMNCTKLGGPAEGTEEHLKHITDAAAVDDFTSDLIENQCSARVTGFGIPNKDENRSKESASACFSKTDKMAPHQFAKMSKAGGKKSPDTLSCKEVQNDHKSTKAWLASALKEIRQLEDKGVWTGCLKSGAKGQQIIPCAWVF